MLHSAVVSRLSSTAVVSVTSADQTVESVLLSASSYQDTLMMACKDYSTVSSYPVEAALLTV